MANMVKSDKIWMNGEFVPWDDAKIHVLAHVLHYGSSVFEGIRAYNTKQGPAIFRLGEHIERFINSAKIYRMKSAYSAEQIERVCLETVAVNNLKDCYIRPLIYRGYAHVGVNPIGTPVETLVAAFPWGKYLGDEAITKGVAVKIGTWARMAPNTLPAMAKAGGNYLNSQLLKLEAVEDGYAEAIALDTQGYVSEGSGENVFIVVKGELITPPVSSSILSGITRDSVMRIAKDMGYTVKEMVIPRELLYIADEFFFTGTAVEITPVTSVDRLPVGNGERGPITKAVQDAFFGMVSGELPDRYGWLSPVPAAAGARK